MIKVFSVLLIPLSRGFILSVFWCKCFEQESTCDMKRAIETRDRKLTVLHEKINSHLKLFDSIEKEAFSIKQVVDNVECVVSEKEELGM